MAIPGATEWIKSTELGRFHRRGADLEAVDKAVAAYETSPSPAGATAIRTALIRWTIAKGADWQEDPRNKAPDYPISTLLETVDNMKLPLSDEVKAIWEEIARTRHDRLAQMLASPPHSVNLKVIDAAQKVYEAARKLEINKGALVSLHQEHRSLKKQGRHVLSDIEEAAMAPKEVASQAQSQLVGSIFDLNVLDLQSLAYEIVAKTGAQALLPVAQHVASMIPVVCLAVDGVVALGRWGKAIKKAYDVYDVHSHMDVIGEGAPRAAVEGLRVLLLREAGYQTTRAALATGALAVNTGLHAAKGAGAVVAPAIAGAKAAAEAAAAIAKFGMEVREAMKAHKILKNPAKNLTLKNIRKSPLLGAYIIDSCDTSDLMAMIWSEFGQPGWMDDIEAMAPALENVQQQAGAVIRASPFIITPPLPVRRASQSMTGGLKIRMKQRWYTYRPW